MSGYCDVACGHPVHGPYHDHEYGFPSSDETVLFERLSLEIMQAGLSWLTVLKKRAALRTAFAGFDVDQVAVYGDCDIARLMEDAGIIRHHLKIKAIIHNAGVIREMRSRGGFSSWLQSYHPQPKETWVRLFKKTFAFTGGEIVGEFLISLGYLPGAHAPSCPVATKILGILR